ncbi:hypothetical protein J6590_009663 [Homalodisca vitripennis]|nr:hypothetical protein J6590_009663 [Homalodisca vitripennis]
MLESPDIAVVAWLPPTHPNGIILKYGIYIRVMDGGHQIDIKNMQQPPSSLDHLRYTFPGLKKRHVYEFFVTAFTKVGESQSTSVASVTPSTKVNAGILSFGGLKVVSWKSDVRLHCRVVGIPEPKQEWRSGDVRINFQQPGSRMELMGDGSLMLKSAQRSDQGEYTCLVSNEHSKDHITFLLLVQVPPTAPLLLVTGNTAHSLQLQWKLGDDGGSPTRGFVIHLKADNGEWEELRVEGALSTYALSNLRCGTLYHVFLTAYNRVGSGSPSQTLPVRTRGSLPLIPTISQLLVVNSTQVGIRLNSWPDGGCPMLYFVLEYATGNVQDYTVVGNNISPDKVYNLVGLSPANEYRLRITAHNSAGSTTTSYSFVTLNSLGVTVVPSQVVNFGDQRQPLHKDIKVVTLSIFSSITLVFSLLALCFCMRRKDLVQRPGGRTLEDVQGTATQDNKHNLARREQYYATVRKLPPSPAHLECIPEYSEDIRPYATFHVSSAGDDTKLQTFAYRESQLSPSRKSTLKYSNDICGSVAESQLITSCFRNDVATIITEEASSKARCDSTSSNINPRAPALKVGFVTFLKVLISPKLVPLLHEAIICIACTALNQKSTTRVGEDYCRVKKARSRSSEDYDSYGSESDTEPGTSSRTESSNQLDERGGFQSHGHGHGHHRKHGSGQSAAAAVSTHEPVFPDWAQSQSPNHARSQYQRRYYHPHQLK